MRKDVQEETWRLEMGNSVRQGHVGLQMVCVLVKVVHQPWNDLVWGWGVCLVSENSRDIMAVDAAGVDHGDQAG